MMRGICNCTIENKPPVIAGIHFVRRQYVVSLDVQLVTAMGRMHTPGQGICMLIL